MTTACDDGAVTGLTPACARELRQDLKAALTAYASRKGDIGAILNEIERVGQYVSGNPDTALGMAEKSMRRLVKRYARARLDDTGLPGVGWKDLYHSVRHARNDLAHTGSEAALAGTRTAALATVLMEALAKAAKENATQRMRDVMVSNPTCAQTWQTLADVRRTMLVNDYSVLPLRDGDCGAKWMSVRAEDLAGYLSTGDDFKRRETLGEAIESCDARLLLHGVPALSEEVPIDRVWSESGLELPIVVTRRLGAESEESEIVGIVTAFDLL